MTRTEASVLGSGDKETIWDYDGDGNDTPNEDPTGRVYRLIERGYTLDDNGEVTSFDYITTFDYNDKGQVLHIDGPREGNDDRVSYTYESDTGNLISVTDPEALVTQYLYDDLGQLVKTDSPDTGLTLYVYDEAGNLIRKEANGLVTTHAYNAADRIIATAYADGSPGVTYTYDTGPGQYLKGRLVAVTDSSGERHFSYDANGYLDTETRIIQGVTYITDYDFDAAGNLRTVVYPTGHTVDYLADSVDVGLTAGVRLDPAGENLALADNITYQPFGPQTRQSLGNGLQTSWTHDLNYRIAAITSGSVLNRTYTPDSHGNIQTITDNLDAARSQSFTYDGLQQFTNATGIYGAIAFTYDKTGNRMTRTADGVTDTYTYVTGTNQLDTITGSAEIKFDHDLNGNLIGRTFTTGPAPSSTPPPDYTYTHDGQRLVKTIDTQTTVYHYDITGQLIAETDASGAMIKAYVWLHGQPLAQITPDGSVYYYHNDHLGTPQRLTDASAAVVWAADYLPFGQADVTMAAIENNLRFSGQYYDQKTGLHYNYWRFYDPALGRYLRADPIGLDGGINLYAYVQNNPVNLIDPYGLSEDEIITKKAYKFVRHPGDLMHGGEHWHVHLRKGGKLLGRVSMAGEVITGSVPRNALKILTKLGKIAGPAAIVVTEIVFTDEINAEEISGMERYKFILEMEEKNKQNDCN